jgi:hypothetical protein
MGFDAPEEYEAAAANLIVDPDTESYTRRDFLSAYYNYRTNGFVTNERGFILTYYEPEDGQQYWLRRMTEDR